MRSAPNRRMDDVWHRYASGNADLTDLDTRVHVWRARLDRVTPGCDNLSDDETARAGRFHRALDRDRFIATRSILRRILADCLDRADDAAGGTLRFSCGPAGKPSLVNDPGLRFSVSHTEGLAAIAVTRAGEVGIDVEAVRPMRDTDRVVRLVFSDAERAAMLGCPPGERDTLFYRIWTRKEALLKAMGVGLAALGDPDAPSLDQGGSCWFLTSLPHLDGFAASLARPRAAHGLRLWSWPNAVGLREVERRRHARPSPPSYAARPVGFHQIVA